MTVNCTNTSCDYFETVFDDAVYKYQARQTIRTWKLDRLMQIVGTTHIFLDYNSRIYCLIRKPEGQLIPLLIAPNIVASKHLFEALKRTPGDYEVSALKHFDTTVMVLKKPSSDIFISNADLENAILFSQSIASRDNFSIVNPQSYIQNA